MEYLRGPPEENIVTLHWYLWYSSGTPLVLPLTWSVHAVKCGHQTIVLQTLLITLLQ